VFSASSVNEAEKAEAVKHRKAFGGIYNDLVHGLREARKMNVQTIEKMHELQKAIKTLFGSYIVAQGHYHKQYDPFVAKLSEYDQKQRRLRTNMDLPGQLHLEIRDLLQSTNIPTFKERLEWIWNQLDAKEEPRSIASGDFIAMTKAINLMHKSANDESEFGTATFLHKMWLYYDAYSKGSVRVQINKELGPKFMEKQMPLEITKLVLEFMASTAKDKNLTLLPQIRHLVSKLIRVTGKVSPSKTPSDTSSADAQFDPETSIECILPVEFVSPVKVIPLVEFSPPIERQPTSDSVISCPSDACAAILDMDVIHYLDSFNPPFTNTGEWEFFCRQ